VDFKPAKVDGFWAFGNSRPCWRARFDPFREGWRFGADGFLGLPFHPVDWKSREWQRTFSSIQIAARKPDRLDLADIPLPLEYMDQSSRRGSILLKRFWDLVRYGRRTTVDGTRTLETMAPEPQPFEPHFRSDVRLVSLAVPVYDRDGHPVPGLTPDDFDLAEDNVPQQIAFGIRASRHSRDLQLALSSRFAPDQ
jgi:hypothetical protein